MAKQRIAIQDHLKSFESLCRFIEKYEPETILKIVSDAIKMDLDKLAHHPMGGYSRIKLADDSFIKGSGSYVFVLQDIKQNLEEYKNLYSRLRDNISRQVFMNQMRFRIIPSQEYLQAAYDLSKKREEYFDEDIFKFNENEVFVDCGGYHGETTEMFVKHCNQYKRAYVYEPLMENAEKCRENLANYENITIRQAGVGRKPEKLLFNTSTEHGADGSFARVASHQEVDASAALEVTSLDEDIKEPVTFIKMDVECFELEAITGAAGHIANDSPKLAICIYHMVSDIWEIPKLINEINPNYDYFLRHYNATQNWDLVLYARASNGHALESPKTEKIGRNDPCLCGSGKKYKRCCGA